MDRKYWVGLSLVPGIGSVKTQRLIEYFGSPQKIWQATEKELLRVLTLGPKTVKSIIKTRETVDLDAFLQQCHYTGIKIIVRSDPEFPINLKEIYDPPSVIYYRGELKTEDWYSIAVVGSRKMTPYGSRVTKKLVHELVERGFTIVSGMALGVDGLAHQTALNAGGRTIAVLGSGVDCVYPKEHRKLSEAIIEYGALISTYPPGTPPEKGNFPARNRIISGLTLGTVVVEAGNRSGALITADQALEQNREVFAVPGSIFNPLSKGTNSLIQKGARPITSAEDVLVEINYCRPEPDIIHPLKPLITPISPLENDGLQLNMFQNKIVSILQSGEMSSNQLVEELGVSMAELNAELFKLELMGVITQSPGQKFALK